MQAENFVFDHAQAENELWFSHKGLNVYMAPLFFAISSILDRICYGSPDPEDELIVVMLLDWWEELFGAMPTHDDILQWSLECGFQPPFTSEVMMVRRGPPRFFN